jgi:hypothetical protein
LPTEFASNSKVVACCLVIHWGEFLVLDLL